MILKVEDLKNLAQTILPAVESTDLTALPETLELVAKNGILNFSVTNKEYLLDVAMTIDYEEDFEATVNATLFLKLISSTTTDTVEINVKDNFLIIKGNGSYKLPLIFENNTLFKIPRINIESIDTEFDIEGDILFSILKYNTRQLSTGILSRPVQKMYYMDEKGAITFTSGACVNKFDLPSKVKLLFNQRLVKLFKLFKGVKTHLVIGSTKISEEITQTKIRFEANNIKLTAILSGDEGMIKSIPAEAIRNRAYNQYIYSVNVNTNQFNDALNRIKLFVGGAKLLIPYIKLTFNSDGIIVSDIDSKNIEVIKYSSVPSNFTDDYVLIVDLNELQAVLDTCTESDLTFNFGDKQCLVISRVSIKNIIPEVSMD